MAETPVSNDYEAERHVPVPASLVDTVVYALRAGADAILDRDWDLFTVDERTDAEQFVHKTFHAPADALEALREL